MLYFDRAAVIANGNWYYTSALESMGAKFCFRYCKYWSSLQIVRELKLCIGPKSSVGIIIFAEKHRKCRGPGEPFFCHRRQCEIRYQLPVFICHARCRNSRDTCRDGPTCIRSKPGCLRFPALSLYRAV